MNKIKVEFHRTDNFVYGRILEMPEEIRNIDRIIKKESYALYSSACPQISSEGKSLFLRGFRKAEDSRWFSYEYNSIKEAMGAIIAFEDLIEEWNEKNADVLDEEERKYLSVVLKPFRNRDVKITKRQGCPQEFIQVEMNRENSLISREYIEFPLFEAGAMYTGMEINKEYSLKELKLIWKEI